MKDTTTCIVLGLVALGFSAALGQRTCEKYERCVAITQCPSLSRLISKNHKLTSAERAVLKNSVCGWQPQNNRIPLVCCSMVPLDQCGPQNTPDKIIGGNRTVVKEFPWAARLGYRVKGQIFFQCGGALINERYVVTAAHCVADGQKPASVRLGEHDTESDVDCSVISGQQVCADRAVDVEVEASIPHPEYEKSRRKPTGLWNDIALVRLRRNVRYSSSITPVCLPLELPNGQDDAQQAAMAMSNLLTVVGWGKISSDDFGDTSRYLMKLSLRSMPHSQCESKYSKFPNRLDSNRQLCAIGKDGTDVCRGDSGGPLTTVTLLGSKVRSVLQGVVSFGPVVCATNGVPGVFARVSNYVPWILDNIKP